MRVFLTGATGFIGSHILPELLARGHEVIGLTRAASGADALARTGARAHLGTLEDLDSLRAGAAQADAVVHTAFDHDFSRFVENCEKDRRVITALGEVLVGSSRPLLITSGVGMGSGAPGTPASEDVFNAANPHPRIASEQAGNALLAQGVNVSVVRLPQVHDAVKQGLITPYIAQARQQGRAAYVGAGDNRWSAAAVADVARLYVLALERGEAGARYHAVAEEGVPMRDIAHAVGHGLGVPVVSLSLDEVTAYFGWMSSFAALDMAASSAITRRVLGWTPTGPTLLEDLARMDYDAVPAT
jgi:nucleoside-diphosphate-sugar epimerase